jgi:hypothetical protein
MDSKRGLPFQALLWTRPQDGAGDSGDAVPSAVIDGAEGQPENAIFFPEGALRTAAPAGVGPSGAITPALPVLRHLAAASQPQHLADMAPAQLHTAASALSPAGSATPDSVAPHIAAAPPGGTAPVTPHAAVTVEQPAPAAPATAEFSGLATPAAADSATSATNGGQIEQIDFTSAPVPAISGVQDISYSLPSFLYNTASFSTQASFGGASISAAVNVFAGIKGSVALGLGDVTPDYPITIDPNALNSVVDNSVFTIDPSLVSTNDASFSLDLPTAAANLDIGLQANAALTINFPSVQIGVSVPFYGYVGTTVGLPSLPISLSVNAAYNPAPNSTLDFGEGASLTISQIGQSSVNSGTASAAGGLPTLTASGSTPSFLTGTIDLVKLLGEVLPESGLEAVDGSEDFSVGSAAWSLFSLPLSVSLGLGETVTVAPLGIMETVTDTLNGESQTGTMGSSFTFNAPASGAGVIPIDISYTLDLQIETSLGLDGTISLALDGPSVSATVLGVGGFNAGPFGQKTIFSESGQFAQIASSMSTDQLSGSSVVDVNYAATAVSQTITTPSSGLLLNNQGEQVTNEAGVTIAGTTYGIEAVAQCVPDITNSGTVSSEAYHNSNPGTPTPTSYGIDLLGGGVVTNTIGGLITSNNYGTRSGHGSNNPDAGIRLATNQANDVYNAGLITGFETGVAINGGMLTNGATGTITTHSAYNSYGIKVGGDGAQITNSGLIDSSFGILLSGGGEVTNTASGVIEGLYSSGVQAGGSLTLTNSGIIISHFTGVAANGGTVTNLSGGLIEGGFSRGVELNGATATLVNAGTIAGNGAVYLNASDSNTLVIEPGAVFDGIVQAAYASAANGIYLAAGSTGTLAGLGTDFTGFQTVTIGEGATWQIAGSASYLSTTTIDGFRPGDTLDFTGLAFTGRGPGYITGESVQVDAATGVVSIIEAESLSSAGITLASAQFGGVLANEGFNMVSDGHGGTLLEQTGPMNATISTQGLGGIVLAPGSVYAGTLSITATGAAFNQGSVSGQTVDINYGIEAQGETASITNAGSVAGYETGIYLAQGGTISNLAGGLLLGTNGSGIDITGGIGIVLNSGLIEGVTGVTLAGGGTLTNYAGGTITGTQFGVDLGPQATGLADLVNEGLVQAPSGTAVELTGGGFVYNEHGGAITGGAITGTNFGVLAVNDFAKVTNCGTISGGTGIDLTAGGFVVNESGVIKGGVVISGGVGYLSSCGSISGVNGVAFSNGGTIVNSAAGTIIGTAGYGVSLGSGSVSDDVRNGGLIECATTGVILSSASNTLFNAGTISSVNGDDAVMLEGGTANTLQLAAGFVFDGAVVAKSGAANSIELTASATAGVLTGLGTSLQGFSTVTLDSGADWTIETTAAEAASLGFSGQSAGDTLALTGGGALGANLSGFGTLLLNGPGTFTIGSKAITGTRMIAIGAGAVLSGNGTLAGPLSGSGTVSAASGQTLDLAGGGTFSGAITGVGTVFLGGPTTLDAGASLSAFSVIAGANVTLASASVTNTAADHFALYALRGTTVALSATGTGAFTNLGTLVAEEPGTAVVSARLVNDGLTEVTAGTLVIAGALSGTGKLSAASGTLLDLKSGGTLTEAISGAGELQLNGAYSLSADNITIATVKVDVGARLSGHGTLTGALVDSGVVVASGGTLLDSGALSGGGTLSAASGEALELAHGGTFAGAITGAGEVIFGGATTLHAGATLSASSLVAQANVTLASVGVTNTAADRFVLDANSGTKVTLGATGSGAFTNLGSFVAGAPGSAVVNAKFINNGTVSAQSGTLSFLSSVAGTGAMDVSSTGTLSLELGAGSGQVVDFLANKGVLDLFNPLDFAGAIKGFSSSDQVFLENTTFTSFGYANNTLTVKDGSATVASLHFAGSSNSFSLANASHGVLITFT